MKKSASEVILELEDRVAQLEKESARRPKSLATTIKELNFVVSRGALEDKDPKLFARLSRDPRLSKDLQSALRNFHKINAKLKLAKRTIMDLGQAEVKEMMDSGYSSEIARIVNIIKDAVSNIRIEYKGKRAFISPYLTFQEGRSSYALEINLKVVQFESRNWGRPGNTMARGTWVSLLDERESEELESLIGKETTKAIEAVLPGFSSYADPKYLSWSDWDIQKQAIIQYLDSL